MDDSDQNIIDERIYELQKKIDINTEMIEAILSGIFDEKIEYKERFQLEQKGLLKPDFVYGKYIIAKRNYLSAGAVSHRVCLKTGGKVDSKGRCYHLEKK